MTFHSLIPLIIALTTLPFGCKSRQTDSNQLASKNDCFPGVRPTNVLYESKELVSWVDGNPIKSDWLAEVSRRENCIQSYLTDSDLNHAEIYGFNMQHKNSGNDYAQHPALGWKWFSESPVGFNGVPYVLLKTILDLDPADANLSPALKPLAVIWHRESLYERNKFTLDHLGIGPNAEDYQDGIALPPERRSHKLPNGLVYEGAPTAEVTGHEKSDSDLDTSLRRYDWYTNTSLLSMKVSSSLDGFFTTQAKVDDYAGDLANKKLQKSGGMDEVFFSCSACHQGRVVVEGKMKFLPGLPNTEIEAQYYSQLLMETAAAIVDGFDVKQNTFIDPSKISAKSDVVAALLDTMVKKARNDPGSFYGSSADEIRRAKLQVVNVAGNFLSVIKDVIGTGVKTHFIYIAGAKQNSYNKSNSPDVLGDRLGQMDAFGIASGLVAIHSKRPDNTFIKFLYDQNPNSPMFKGFPRNPNPLIDPKTLSTPSTVENLGPRIFASMNEWMPHLPAAIDVRSLAFAKDNTVANWDGNQTADARTLASGTSATGDPRKVNVRIHEPLNPFIDNLPPPPYPFKSVDLNKAKIGKELFKERCFGCHRPKNDTIYTINTLGGVDANRSLITSSVSQLGLGSLVMEACVIYATQNNGEPGYNWCLPNKADCVMSEPSNDPTKPNWCKNAKDEKTWASQMDAYFKDIPARIAKGQNGYKADVLHGIWGRAPYLHNGSVPTLGHLLCSKSRPSSFLRGNVYYDESMVGFEWNDKPVQRYSAYDTILVKQFDTSIPGRGNHGHTFADPLCPEGLEKMDPVKDRQAIAKAISASKAGAVIEFLKTL